jgi:hypothetical protein
MKKTIFWGLIAAFVSIQFVPFFFKKKSEPVTANASMKTVMAIPEDIKSILKKSCADCHSQQTDYPWYSHIQPLGMWIDHHIEEGKEHFNMDDFANYTPEDQTHMLEEMAEVVAEGEMPLKSYTLMHRDAKLTPAEKARFMDWAIASSRGKTESEGHKE